MADAHGYPAEYYKLLAVGSVDHEFTKSLYEAAGDSEKIQSALESRGFEATPERVEALAGLDWERIQAVATAFGATVSPQLIC